MCPTSDQSDQIADYLSDYAAVLPQGTLTDRDLSRLEGAITTALMRGFPLDHITRKLAAPLTDDVVWPGAALVSRVRRMRCPRPAARRRQPPRSGQSRPAWCGSCDERTRLRMDPDGCVSRCPRCHPLVRIAA